MTGTFLAGVAVWLSGVLVGVMFTGYVFYQWMRQDPRRLGLVIRWIIAGISQHTGGTFVKVYAALFDTNRASKVMVYVKPEDLCEAIGWYARKLDPFPLSTNPAWPGDKPDDNRASKEDSG